jgi:hypothetical protein
MPMPKCLMSPFILPHWPFSTLGRTVAIKLVFASDASEFIYLGLLEAKVPHVRSLKVGVVFKEDTFMVPISDTAQFEYINQLFADGSTKTPMNGKGYYVMPITIDDLLEYPRLRYRNLSVRVIAFSERCGQLLSRWSTMSSNSAPGRRENCQHL